MTYSIFDIEGDGLIDTVTRIHCLCYFNIGVGESKQIEKYGESGRITEYSKMVEFIDDIEIGVGHNICRYDIPVLEKVLAIKCKFIPVDTLALSWYLYPNRTTHGLEDWGVDVGIAKPPIVDWKNAPIEDYLHRCSEDVRINVMLFKTAINYIWEIYGRDNPNGLRIVHYLTYKMDCAREQEQVKWKLDVEKCRENLTELLILREQKVKALTPIMPPVTKYKVKSRPKVFTKQDGELSQYGQKWVDLCTENDLPEYHIGAIRVVDKVLAGNPRAQGQVKAWLFSLGWIPTTFKYVKEWVDGRQKERAIPQIASDDQSGVCSSIKRMFIEHPYLMDLEDLYVLGHRIGMLEGFLECVNDDGFLIAEIAGLTNTLRFQHKKPLANIPQTPKKYWSKIRELLIAPTDRDELCGADMTGLEDNTKQHYMYFFDKQYVQELRTPGFDPHLDIAVLSGLLTHEQAEAHKLYDKSKGKEGVSSKDTRLKAKKVNFAAIYGAKAAKIAATANISLSEAKKFYSVYWQRNKAVKDVAASCRVQTINGQKWLFNPISKFWLTLREEKDRFSTLNQSTGVFCFDTWVRHVRSQGVKVCGQFHDEIIFPITKGNRTGTINILHTAIEETNKDLKLNVPLKISVAFGDRYSSIH